jgi:hypothetical protein
MNDQSMKPCNQSSNLFLSRLSSRLQQKLSMEQPGQLVLVKVDEEIRQQMETTLSFVDQLVSSILFRLEFVGDGFLC